jgi:S-adenosylmethionine:tRNA ribosyltransferase-isomerase
MRDSILARCAMPRFRAMPLQCAPMTQHPDNSARPEDYHFELPPQQIAQQPLPNRQASRLLYLPGDEGGRRELVFSQLGELLHPGDLLVLNDTRVIPARLFGHKASGGKVEMLLERILEPDRVLAQLRSSRSPAVGAELIFESGARAHVEGRRDNFFVLRFSTDVQSLLEQHGHMPLPPYIERSDEPFDRERYQTVYAERAGAVAAPTAGLHFADQMLAQLTEQGVQQAKITLHVGAGTFLPLREEQLASGRLHAERIEVSQACVDKIEATRAAGGRVVAVGTTVTRALESAAASGALRACSGETDLFIRPGYDFRVVDAMVTNFHLPGSSLLMLVAAFRGRETLLDAYAYAVQQGFRFFSYGDAMFIEKARLIDKAPV